ncbi:ABC transporter, ATP-binding protein [uncultured Desulfatiglans sp.]|uniref:ABC transporter, ATP-binding protein n=1 Tax=Uncultured Desulfatiglans sp. TaxID=1748965 RepID=A0A653AE48_UNCDX|nr:ABC transporter, ATP-binding protein [uncultured Desulfatiglans sp.]
MSLVTVMNLSLTFLNRPLFEGVGFSVESGDRIGLVGPNGSGKSTLLRLITGEMAPDEGEIRIARGTLLGYLPQDVQESLSGSLLQAVIDSVPQRRQLRADVQEAEAALRGAVEPAEQARSAERLAELHGRIDHLEQTYPLHEAEKILIGLGFKQEEFSQPIASLSGGWKMRAALAGLLYQRPDLLLLDEPTNHLDIPSVHWLEQFLQSYSGAMVLVSHDREFLNRQVKRIMSFETEGMRVYSGDYDFYLKAREEEERALEAKARNQEQKVKEAQRFIERFQAKASKARQAQSKLKLVQKMEIVKTHKRTKTIHFTFPAPPQSGREVLRIEGLSKRFGPKTLYRDVNLRVMRGERIAVIGPNGCGKTTLLKMIAGELPPDEGGIALGHNVEMGYFAQHHSDTLDPRKSVLEEVYTVVPHETVSFVRNVCGAFLFSGSDVDKPIEVLSGGERARVALAKLLVKPGNLMVMDEPSNHLDITSSEKLIDALSGYQGTLLFVSHNQSFVNRLATKIWDVGPQGVEEYPGNLTEYYEHLERLEKAAQTSGSAAAAAPQNGAPATLQAPEPSNGRARPNRKDLKRERAERRRVISEKLRPIETDLARIETRITELEALQADAEKRLADPEVFKDKIEGVRLLTQYNQARRDLADLLERWEARQEELESAKAELGVLEEA